MLYCNQIVGLFDCSNWKMNQFVSKYMLIRKFNRLYFNWTFFCLFFPLFDDIDRRLYRKFTVSFTQSSMRNVQILFSVFFHDLYLFLYDDLDSNNQTFSLLCCCVVVSRVKENTEQSSFFGNELGFFKQFNKIPFCSAKNHSLQWKSLWKCFCFFFCVDKFDFIQMVYCILFHHNS